MAEYRRLHRRPLEVKRALIVGNDQYDHMANLHGCVNDASALHPLLARHADGSPNFDCMVGTNLTRDTIVDKLDHLFSPGATSILLFFAGHGDESSSDVVLCSSDGTTQTPGVSFSEVLSRIPASGAKEIVILLDCCFSGAAGGVPALSSAVSAIHPGLSILAASRGDQASEESPTGRGLFSTYLEGGLDGGASDTLGHVDMGSLYAYVSESFGAWDQRPTFKANIEHPLELRICDPPISRPELRQVLELFEESFSEFPLDPSFEPDAPPPDPENERTFGLLQKARACRLVEPVNEDHLYFAAMNSTACRLTPLGRHYHHVHSHNRL